MNKEQWILSCLSEIEAMNHNLFSPLLKRLVKCETFTEQEDFLATSTTRNRELIFREIKLYEDNFAC